MEVLFDFLKSANEERAASLRHASYSSVSLEVKDAVADEDMQQCDSRVLELLKVLGGLGGGRFGLSLDPTAHCHLRDWYW